MMFFKQVALKQCLFTLMVVAISSASYARSTAHDWAKITKPTANAGQSESIGAYTHGCISGAAVLPLEGTGYQVMRLSRHRYYGHSDLIGFIEKLGQFAATEKLGSLLIGDLGQPRGGPTLSGHRSHQTGLDVDVWFLLSEEAAKRELTENERETWGAPSFVNMKNDTVNNRWTEAHERILEAAAQQPDVDRIFVNPSIKQALCDNYHEVAGTAQWLRKIRPWRRHDDHFHVRLKCPSDNKHCEGQEPLPKGDGCDASLAWWFTYEAKHPKKEKKLPPPPLPALCEEVLDE
jgi:penicillin-insensitive murein endopeptidase